MAIIDDVTEWLEIRELRNVLAHDYAESHLSVVYQRLKELCPKLLAIEDVLCD